MSARRNSVAILVAIVAFGVVRGLISRRSADGPIRPAPDLRRVTFPAAGLAVSEHSAKRLEVSTGSWVLSVDAISSEAAANSRRALRGMAARARSAAREDVLDAPGGPTLHRYLRGDETPHRATQAQYLVSFDGSWALALAHSRSVDVPVDLEPIDKLLLGLRLHDGPRPDADVLPAWRSYQRDRSPGTPIGKFVLSMAPVPVGLGSRAASAREWAPFTIADWKRGGRQVAADHIEFYTKDDPSSVRVDLWVEEPPRVPGREAVFDGTLRVDDDSVALWSSPTDHQAPVAAGQYDVTVTLINRGKDDDRSLTDQERFARDDLERYEVRLKRRPAD